MEFKIEKEDFVKGLSLIQSVVEKKVTMPILSNALIETKGTGILMEKRPCLLKNYLRS
ncbi:MAG: hypothetical protein NTY64_20785 [Deltaproteobacteria bacterium]|nr:hypothetical protein [Deltaproteobacteria bacterium]